jgi:hypothetical protein
MDKLGKALPPVIMAAAIAVAFGVMMFLTVCIRRTAGRLSGQSRSEVRIGGRLWGRAMNEPPLTDLACSAAGSYPLHAASTELATLPDRMSQLVGNWRRRIRLPRLWPLAMNRPRYGLIFHAV